MKPNLQHRQLVTVRAGISWDAALRHRVYSCPDEPEFDFVQCATALVLLNSHTGERIPLEISSVTKVSPAGTLDQPGLAVSFRERAEAYLAEVGGNGAVIHPGSSHRLYFLSTEPWPHWLQQLTKPEFTPLTQWSAIMGSCAEPERFFEWPQVGALLWPGCTRGDGLRPHQYPQDVAERLRRLGIHDPDTRSNGPAIMAFLAAGGIRPKCGCEGWHIHHIYDGTEGAPHAVNEGNLFTHSAGLVAAHPVAHDLAHQSRLLKGLLRREAFLRFGFDPVGAFANA